MTLQTLTPHNLLHRLPPPFRRFDESQASLLKAPIALWLRSQQSYPQFLIYLCHHGHRSMRRPALLQKVVKLWEFSLPMQIISHLPWMLLPKQKQEITL